MEPPQTIYKQSATHVALPLYLCADTEVDGRLIADLAEMLLSTLPFPGTRLTALHTKRPGDAPGSTWVPSRAADGRPQKKILSNDYAAVSIEAETPDFPNQNIWFNAHVNPIDRDEFLISGMWKARVLLP